MKILIKLYANLNLGDDLFLKILLERYPNVKFILPAPDEYKDIFKNYSNLEIVKDAYNFEPSFINRVFNYVRRRFFLNDYVKRIESRFLKNFTVKGYKFDAFISIGGSIFMQQKQFPVYSNVIYYKLAQKYCKNTFYLGCNFGPYNDPKFFKSYKDIFSKARDICFRERFSWDLFSDISNVRHKPDIVFGLKFPKAAKKNRTVGFSVVSARNGINEENYLKKYAELIEFYQKENYEIYLFSFCENQGDGKTINSIIDLVSSHKNLNKIIYNGDIDKFLDVYSSMEQMYCGRFHAMILSMVFDQKIFPVIYSKKMLNVLDDIDYRGETINLENFFSIQPDKLLNQIGMNFYDVKEFKDESVEQFQKLDLFLENTVIK